MLALFYVFYKVVFVARRHANVYGSQVGRTFLMCGVWTMFLWFLYPIAWGLSEGGNVIHPDSEAIFYGILDIAAKPVFTALLLWGHRKIDINTIGMNMREPGEGYRSSTEKPGYHGGPAGGPVSDGAGTGHMGNNAPYQDNIGGPQYNTGHTTTQGDTTHLGGMGNPTTGGGGVVDGQRV